MDLDNVEKEFNYTNEYMGLHKDKATVVTEEFQNTKSRQEENVREVLHNTDNRDVLYLQMDQPWETQDQQEQGRWST